jgi:hypothetical protein
MQKSILMAVGEVRSNRGLMNVLKKGKPVRELSTHLLAASSLPLISILAMAPIATAQPAVLIESDISNVVKIEYTGSSLDNVPILSVSGEKNRGAMIEGKWRGLTGRVKVPGQIEPFPSLPAGVAAAGPIGLAALGSGSGSLNIGAHIMTVAQSSTTNYGAEVWASGGVNAYGIYARATGGTNQNWAGYFNGSTYATGTYQGSDQMFKKNVVDYSGGLDKVLALRPKSYDTRVEEFKNEIDLPRGRQVGLIAQDLMDVMPELVTDVRSPPQLTKEEMAAGVEKEGLKFKAVNYTGLIPVLIAAVQEQHALIEALQAEVAALKAR